MRSMGTAAGVPIEPPEQTALLNGCVAVAGVLGGGGGGKPDVAQGGGTDASRVTEALDAVRRQLSAGAGT